MCRQASSNLHLHIRDGREIRPNPAFCRRELHPGPRATSPLTVSLHLEYTKSTMRTMIAMLYFVCSAVVSGAPMSTSARLAQLEQQVKVLELKLPSEGSMNLAELVTEKESPRD